MGAVDAWLPQKAHGLGADAQVPVNPLALEGTRHAAQLPREAAYPTRTEARRRARGNEGRLLPRSLSPYRPPPPKSCASTTRIGGAEDFVRSRGAGETVCALLGARPNTQPPRRSPILWQSGR